MEVNTVEISCHTCGVTWWITKRHDDELRRTHAEFYCPGGHSQYYPSPTKAEKQEVALINLRERVASQTETIRGMRKGQGAADRSHAALRGQITKLKRAGARRQHKLERFEAELEAVAEELRDGRERPMSAAKRGILAGNIVVCLRWDPEAEGGTDA